jgi:hypothetical protein
MRSLRRLSIALLTMALAGAAAAQQDEVAATLLPPRRWALVVGAGDYEHLGRLRYAARDAEALAAALVENLGFEADTVRLLTDTSDDPRLTPTAGHLIGELESLLADPRRNQSDLFVFYFCGHGAGREAGDFLLPTDARPESLERVGLPVREVVDRLSGAGMRNVLFIADACRQGAANPFGRELWDLADRARLSVVLGCEPGQQSYEDRFFGHGVFTHFLLDALDDASLHDGTSGALWASRVMREVAARVRAHTADRGEPQSPAAWTDPTRDVLLGVRLPEDRGAAPDFAAGLAPDAQVAALTGYAWALLGAGRHAATVEVLKAAEQLGPLPPEVAQALGGSLLHLGRSIEAARVFAALRSRAPDSLPALAATVSDSSGAIADADRARAAAALWDSGARLPLGLLARMVEAQLRGGSTVAALEIARTALPQAPDGSRDQLYLAALVALLEQRGAEAAELLEAASRAPGDNPDDRLLARERVGILAALGGPEAGIPALDACIERWPDEGEWYAQRAWLRRLAGADPAAVLDDVRLALARPLDGGDLLGVVRCAGGRAPELAAEVAARAAEHPLSWQAGLAAAFCAQAEDLREQVAAAARLAARPALCYATMARLTLDAAAERLAEILRTLPEGAPERAQVEEEFVVLVRTLFERIAPMAADFGGDAAAWSVLAELAQRNLAHEAFHRLAEQHLGASVDAGSLPEGLIDLFGRSCLDTGRLERFRALERSLLRDEVERDARRWLEAAYLAAAGADAEARLCLGERTRPLRRRLGELALPLRATLAARGGDPEAARALLAETPAPAGMLGRCFVGLAEHALGAREAAGVTFAGLQGRNPEDALFAYLALWRAAGVTAELPQLAALYQPGNPLLHEVAYADEPGLEAFVGGLEYRVEAWSGPVDASGATLTLTVLRTGRVVGALERGDSALVVRGQLDAFGNFEGELVEGERPHRLVAKLAPASAHSGSDLLAATGQLIQIWGTGNVPFAWSCRLAP